MHSLKIVNVTHCMMAIAKIGKAKMIRWYRSNPYLGIYYEISEKVALRKINSKNWIRHYDNYWQKFTNMWINMKDPNRDVIFRRNIDDNASGCDTEECEEDKSRRKITP